MLELLGEAATKKAKEWKDNGGPLPDEGYSPYGPIKDMMTYHEAYQYLVENHVKTFGVKPLNKQKEKLDKKRVKEMKRRRSFHAICATEHLIQCGLTAKEERLIHETEVMFSALNMEGGAHQPRSRRRSVIMSESDQSDFSRKSSLKSKTISLAVEPNRSRSLRRNSLQVNAANSFVETLSHSPPTQDSLRRRKNSKRSKSKNKNLSPEL